jgi:FMN-dependent NADH-azoreductase
MAPIRQNLCVVLCSAGAAKDPVRLRAAGGITFRYTESGPVGLLEDKRAIVIETRGGLYSEGPAQALDSQEHHLRALLGLIGITDVTFVRAEKLAFGPEAQKHAIDAARQNLGQALATTRSNAA